jgi:hypothetical protein
LFILCVIASIVIVFSFVNGSSDEYYLKLTTPKQGNLILGTSKAAQGVQPKVLESILNKKFYNYSFSLFASPYGRTYLNSIKKKLDTSTKDNIFILTVDPWSICSLTQNPNDSLHFREKNSFLHSVRNVNRKPNFNYLVHHFQGNYYKIIFNKSPAFLHNDGWLEVNLNIDNNEVKRRIKFTVDDYRKKLTDYKYSDVRFAYLIKTMDYLNAYGKVYLVRLPVDPDLMKVENTLMPDFDAVIQKAIETSDGYLNFSTYNSDYKYTDGVHLNKESGEKLSSEIANWIKTKE